MIFWPLATLEVVLPSTLPATRLSDRHFPKQHGFWLSVRQVVKSCRPFMSSRQLPDRVPAQVDRCTTRSNDSSADARFPSAEANGMNSLFNLT
jgi:hypothetical protein